MLLHGIFPPITTPFYPDGNVYFKKIEHNVERYSRTPVAGIVVLGSTGEAIMLSDQERRDVLTLVTGIPRDVTIVMIEHDMDVALDFAERITVLHFGQVVVEGTRGEVVAHPRTREIYLVE